MAPLSSRHCRITNKFIEQALPLRLVRLSGLQVASVHGLLDFDQEPIDDHGAGQQQSKRESFIARGNHTE
jgi:hypothetical protein